MSYGFFVVHNYQINETYVPDEKMRDSAVIHNVDEFLDSNGIIKSYTQLHGQYSLFSDIVDPILINTNKTLVPEPETK